MDTFSNKRTKPSLDTRANNTRNSKRQKVNPTNKPTLLTNTTKSNNSNKQPVPKFIRRNSFFKLNKTRRRRRI